MLSYIIANTHLDFPIEIKIIIIVFVFVRLLTIALFVSSM